MSKEILYLRFLQISVSLLTPILMYSIYLAAKGKVSLHKKINGGIMVIVAIAVIGLLTTLVMGFDYKSILPEETLFNFGPSDMNKRLMIHRGFSTPLFLCLLYTTWAGAKKKLKSHRLMGRITVFFWLGTLISALLFF